MKRALALMFAVLVLAGCTAAAEPAPTPSLSAEDVYVQTVRDTNALVGAKDDNLIRLGNSICEAMKDGTSFDGAVDLLGTGGVDDPDDAEIIAAAAIDAFCPEVDGG